MTQVLDTDVTHRPDDPTRTDDRYRRRLEEERRFRVDQLAALEAESCPTTPHESVHRALLIAASTALDEIDAALDRLSSGRYGRCVTCSAELPAERLDVLPMAALCMACHYNQQNCAQGMSV
jgi:RNA polymerase-binding transcription factor DksA